MKDFSVCMSVYKNDKPEFLVEALGSLFEQTLIPTEIVLVEDGPVTDELEKVVRGYEIMYPAIMNVVRCERNGGLGTALRIGVEHSHYDLIARMDSDDISHPERFEKQMQFMHDHPEVDICGGDAAKFESDIKNIIGYTRPAYEDAEMKKVLQDRTPFCHVTIMAKKEAIIKSGNYIEIFNQEDYYLWTRMAQAGCIFANLKDVLVYVRVLEIGSRRGGWRYFKNELFMQNYLLKAKIISFPKYIKHLSMKFTFQMLFTSNMRQWAYTHILRVNK